MISEDMAGQFTRGLRAFRSGDYQAAVEYLSKAVEYDENDHRAWNALGTACAKVGRYADADLCYENAIILAPDNQMYRKNRNTNAKNLKKPSLKERITSRSILDRSPFDKIPFDIIPLDKKYVIAGAAGVLIILLISILTLTGVIFHAPSEPAGPPIALSANLSGSTIILTNKGGPDIASVSSFTWKINEKVIGSGKPGDPGTLEVVPGSTATVPLIELIDTNLSNGIRIIAIANYKDGNGMVALDTKLPPPPADALPRTISAPEVTPTPIPDVPRFGKGEVVIDNSTGTWWIVILPPANGTYTLARAARLPDGSFASADNAVVNMSLKSLEKTARSIGNKETGEIPPGVSSLTPPPASAVPALHPEPLYIAGDLIGSGSKDWDTALAVLGYDQVTDQYQVDTLTRYYTGEWGYRSDITPEWYIRPALEQQYPRRISHITLSDIGVGSDSAPPRTEPKYSVGDIISPDTAALENLLVIISYNPGTDQYETDSIRSASTGGWIRTGKTSLHKRVFIERDHPVKIRTVDIGRVQKE
jgi:hypothetical protein